MLSLALLLVVAAAIQLWAGTSSGQVADEGRAQVPGTVEFDGEARRYDVLYGYRALQGGIAGLLMIRRAAREP